MNLKRAFVGFKHQHLFDSEHGIEHEHHASYLRCRCGERLKIRLEEGDLR
jgi:hypothetical protein